MSARTASTKALRQVSGPKQQVRRLSIIPTGLYQPKSLDAQRPALSKLPKDVSSLRAECRKRNLPTGGNKIDLIDRLTHSAIRRSRSFTTAATAHISDKERPSSYSTATSPAIRLSTTPPPPKGVRRTINTSRSLQAQRDTSTIDFAYLPTFPLPAFGIDTNVVAASIPILPDNESRPNIADELPVTEAIDTLPTILTVAGESTHFEVPTAAHEVHDNTAVAEAYHQNIATGELGAAVERTGEEMLNRAREEATKIQEGMVGQVWKGMMDDLFGPKQGPKSS